MSNFPFLHSAAHPALAHLRSLTRERFGLSEETVIMVTELACSLPGCPPLETIFAFWPEDRQRRQFKIFKPVAQITECDLPPRWMKNALIVPDWIDCECC